MVPADNGPALWKEKKKKKKRYFLTQRKFHQIPALPIHTLKLVTEFLSHMTQALLKLLPLHWYLELVSSFMSPSRAESWFRQPSGPVL